MIRGEDGVSRCLAESDTEATVEIAIDSDVIAKMHDYFNLPED